MKHFVVLYTEEGMDQDEPPLIFKCWADDREHAEEQCRDANPGVDIALVSDGCVYDALASYYGRAETCH